ncbi:MFS transporter [Hyalangium versicolor]|uniref:MFS transporter n=1 Tax=Hyalangium versicolor TaxID=2861190 RepID=UPI001CCA2F89|nr:MFS transporter [Hyalangium versicolor]
MERALKEASSLVIADNLCLDTPPRSNKPHNTRDKLLTFVFVCDESEPRVAFELSQDRRRVGDWSQLPIRVRPYTRRGSAWSQHYIDLTRGDLLQVGSSHDALPGVRIWEVPAPPGQARFVFPPPNLLSACTQWVKNNPSPNNGFFFGDLNLVEEEQFTSEGTDFACVLPVTPPFAMELRFFVPDVTAVKLRALWTAAFTLGPVLLLILLFWVAVDHHPAVFVWIHGVAIASVALSAILQWRLLWAHRLDMLKAGAAAQRLVEQNQLLVILVGASLAGCAAAIASRITGRPGLPLLSGRDRWRMLLGALLGWGSMVWLGTTLSPLGHMNRGAVFQMLLSLALPTFVIFWPDLQGLLERRRRRSAYFIITFAVAGAMLAFSNPVARKLLLAWSMSFALYWVLRQSAREGVVESSIGVQWLNRLYLLRWLKDWHLDIVFVAGGMFLTLWMIADNGVTVTFGAAGLTAATVAVLHDRIGWKTKAPLENRVFYRRFVLWECALAVLGTIGLCLCFRNAEGGAPGAPGVITRTLVVLILAGCSVYLGMLVWALINTGSFRFTSAVLALAILVPPFATAIIRWAPEIREEILSSSVRSPYAQRLSTILDPSYALLFNDESFELNLSAFDETARGNLPELLADGQGYFGAEIADRGVKRSIENDYFAVIILKEMGALGVVRLSLLVLVIAGGIWLNGAGWKHTATLGGRWRRIGAFIFAAVGLYQPIASLGLLPMTGISWPGFGIDSPSDFWPVAALILFGYTWIDVQPAEEGQKAPSGIQDGGQTGAAVFTVALMGLGGLFVHWQGARFAAERKAPFDRLENNKHKFRPGFEPLLNVLEFVDKIHCDARVFSDIDELKTLPPPNLPVSDDPFLVRFRGDLFAMWDAQASTGPTEQVREFLTQASREAPGTSLDGCKRAAGISTRWQFRAVYGDDESTCEVSFKFGWPDYKLKYTYDHTQRVYKQECSIDDNENNREIARRLGPLPRNQLVARRVRLLSAPMGDASRDVGELLSRDVVVRLRPGAKPSRLDLQSTRPGIYFAESVVLTGNVELSLRKQDGGYIVQAIQLPIAQAHSAQRDDQRSAFVFSRQAEVHMQQVDSEGGRWKFESLESSAKKPFDLTHLSILITPHAKGLSSWMFRPRGSPENQLDTLLADDVITQGKERRRAYVYGGLVPELGWSGSGSAHALGLDGWIQTALLEHNRSLDWLVKPESDKDNSIQETSRFINQYCGLLAPLRPDKASPAVCTANDDDGVLECRVTIQPELEIRLRHLLEMVSLSPSALQGDAHPALSASFALLHGGTGAIVAQGEFVPGRESTVYAPRTPPIESRLRELLDDYDPVQKTRTPKDDSAEKLEWSRPIAIGSTLKPLVARAAELTDPDTLKLLRMSDFPRDHPTCGSDSNRFAPVLGYCPPTSSIWPRNPSKGQIRLQDFLARSPNWYQAALGLIGPALGPRGQFRFGPDDHEGTWRKASDLASLSVGRYPLTEYLRVRNGEKEVIGGGGAKTAGTVDQNALRATPFWAHLEKLLGRELCIGESKEGCRRESVWRDLCAARALPVTNPRPGLRRFVSLGDSRFDFNGSPSGDGRQPVSEYFQFLRGAGKHEAASILQLADTYNRLIYDSPNRDGRYQLVASWFPAPASGRPLPPPCSSASSGGTVADGLCQVVFGENATAAKLKKPFTQDWKGRILLHGAKTGTIDSLGDIQDDKRICYNYDAARTLPNRDAPQAYHLCGPSGKRPVDDSLFVIGFSVSGTPLTLALRFQGVGGHGFAVDAAKPFIEVIADYFAPEAIENR